VQRAKLFTTLDGTALDTFWISDLSGSKLSAPAAAAVATRLRCVCEARGVAARSLLLCACSDFLDECSPKDEPPSVLQSGNVCVDSSAESEECTLVKVCADPLNNGSSQLLDIASTLSGLGITIREADLEQGGPSAAWVFRVLSARGSKLDYAEAAALLFLLGGAGSSGNLQRSSRGQISVPL